MSQKVSELTKSEFDSFTKKGLVLVDFYADWCMPCVMMAPVMEELGKKFKNKITFGKLNVDDNKEIAQKYNIRSIPNFILFDEGKIKDNFVGAIYIEEFEKKLKEHLVK